MSRWFPEVLSCPMDYMQHVINPNTLFQAVTQVSSIVFNTIVGLFPEHTKQAFYKLKFKLWWVIWLLHGDFHWESSQDRHLVQRLRTSICPSVEWDGRLYLLVLLNMILRPNEVTHVQESQLYLAKSKHSLNRACSITIVRELPVAPPGKIEFNFLYQGMYVSLSKWYWIHLPIIFQRVVKPSLSVFSNLWRMRFDLGLFKSISRQVILRANRLKITCGIHFWHCLANQASVFPAYM